MPLETSAQHPVPVRKVALLIGQWIGRLGAIWVEGQVTQLTRRPGARTVFLTLRDPAADISLSVTCSVGLLDSLSTALVEGSRLVVHARPEYYVARGTLSLNADEIRQVGIGELLARLDQLKRVLAAEGLFESSRKRPLPFLPRVIGLVCGRASAAEKDVVENARRRWPAVRFRSCEVAVQGVNAVTEVSAALQRLDADPEVDVIVITRGGGSVEDLLPFSNEALVRVVSSCRTPVVSAIGHETDSPLLDLVADSRASTPTDAAKQIVPDMAEQLRRIADLRARLRRSILARLEREQHSLTALRSRPVLAEPHRGLLAREAEISTLKGRLRRTLGTRLDRAADDLVHTRARIAALSPGATLARGYAVVTRTGGQVVRRPDQVVDGEQVRLRLAEGELAAAIISAAVG